MQTVRWALSFDFEVWEFCEFARELPIRWLFYSCPFARDLSEVVVVPFELPELAPAGSPWMRAPAYLKRWRSPWFHARTCKPAGTEAPPIQRPRKGGNGRE